jgi:hypothetical protein
MDLEGLAGLSRHPFAVDEQLQWFCLQAGNERVEASGNRGDGIHGVAPEAALFRR